MNNFWGQAEWMVTLPITDETGLMFWAGVVAIVVAGAIWVWPRR